MGFKVGIDFAGKNSPDLSGVAIICTKCKTILQSATYFPGTEVKIEIPTFCPVCATTAPDGTRINNGQKVWLQESNQIRGRRHPYVDARRCGNVLRQHA